jgi:hypothetical protein
VSGTLTNFAIHDTEAFIAMCDKLRARGVVKLGALVLGPVPPTPADREEKDPDAKAKREHETMFAAVRYKPPFEPRIVESDTPRIVVQRRQRDEAALNGKAVAKR